MAEALKGTKTSCYHCGESCNSLNIVADDKYFCCDGCRFVYQLLQENNLCSYYEIDEKSKVVPKAGSFGNRFAFLDEPSTAEALISSKLNDKIQVNFQLPQIHCSSCIWILEHLYRLDPGIQYSRTDFTKKELFLEFDGNVTSLRKVVELLTTIGYEPRLFLDSLDKRENKNSQQKRIYRIVVAGFCFANIMMLSFPEYFHIGQSSTASLQRVFSYLNLALSIPALFFSGGEFFKSATNGIRGRYLNIDVPLVLSIVITFGRSLYEIISGTGAGYLDSMTGIIFFMLVGRYFQERTTRYLDFDRNYRSYFPIYVTIPGDQISNTIPLSKLNPGMRILVRSQEIIPADSKVISGEAWIDYSFVTGESLPVKVNCGEIIYAGGKQTKGIIELEVLKEVDQGHLTSLWNRQPFKSEKRGNVFIDGLAKNFTIFLILLSAASFIYWLPVDPLRGLNALTTVLIVACPCALLLSSTFTNGNVMRIFSRNGFYLKRPEVIESLSKTTHVVFDKTGTITLGNSSEIHFTGAESPDVTQLSMIYSLCRQSNHPLSNIVSQQLSFCDQLTVVEFEEIPGSGISGIVQNHKIRAGSSAYLKAPVQFQDDNSAVHIEIDHHYLGYFEISNTYRPGLKEVISILRNSGKKTSLLSGDHSTGSGMLGKIFGKDSALNFNQSPHDKLKYIDDLQHEGESVMMVGDGLNDAGALRQSNTGIAVSDNLNNFAPGCDAILDAGSFNALPVLIRMSVWAQRIISWSFVISLLYNIVGLSFAVRGDLSPVIAAILMPLSSLTILVFTSCSSNLIARYLRLR